MSETKGKVIAVNFQNRSRIILNERGSDDNLDNSHSTIPWNSNPYNTYQMSELLQESMRFNGVIERNNNVITAEICRWGIPLFEAIAYQAETQTFRKAALTSALELRDQLKKLTTPGGVA